MGNGLGNTAGGGGVSLGWQGASVVAVLGPPISVPSGATSRTGSVLPGRTGTWNPASAERTIASRPNLSDMKEAETTRRRDAPEFLGIFAPWRAGALAGISGNRIGQWARYGLIRPSHYVGRPHNLYAFNDVAEGIVIRWLLERKFSYKAIHAAIEKARVDHPDWPLLEAPLGVAQHAVAGDPRGVIVLQVEKGVYVETAEGGEQMTLKPELLEHARDMLRRGGWIADQLRLKRIEVDPQKLGGVPSLRGRRWPIERIVQIAADSKGRRLLVEDYGLDRRDIDESVRWVDHAAAL